MSFKDGLLDDNLKIEGDTSKNKNRVSVPEIEFNEKELGEVAGQKTIQEVKPAKELKVDAKLSDHQKWIKDTLAQIKENPKLIGTVAFIVKDTKNQDSYFEIIDPWKICAAISTEEEMFNPGNLQKFFSAHDALHEYKIYINWFQSFLFNYSLFNKDAKTMERLMPQLNFSVSTFEYENIVFYAPDKKDYLLTTENDEEE